MVNSPDRRFCQVVAAVAGMLLLLCAAELVSFAGMVVENSLIPPGTILPLRLDKPFSIKGAQKGQALQAKIAQEVPFPDGEYIPVRSPVRGTVLSVESEPEDGGVKVTIKFDQLEAAKKTIPFTAYLRAIASLRAAQKAQSPHSGADVGTPTGWADTVQIGGDNRFGDGGDVRDAAKQKIGKGVRGGGVLVHVRANPTLGCEGPVNMDDHLQALWVFSSDACGVYDMKGAKIAHTGKGAPVGEITLHFDKDNVKLEAGTAILLRTVSSQTDKP